MNRGVVYKNSIFLMDYINSFVKKGVQFMFVNKGTLYVYVDKKELKDILFFLQNDYNLRFRSLMDIWGVDYPDNEKRFEVCYNLLSVKYNYRIVVKVNVGSNDFLSSVEGIYKSAGWLEREVFDMYGVMFEGNSDMRRILTDYGFEGFPLRKDFPLVGYVEVRYDDTEKMVVLELIEVMQEFRFFNFLSPWETKRGLLDVEGTKSYLDFKKNYIL